MPALPVGAVRVCVVGSYAPFVMTSIYKTGNDTLSGPVPFDILDSLLPAGLSQSPDDRDFQLAGFDIDYRCATCLHEAPTGVCAAERAAQRSRFKTTQHACFQRDARPKRDVHHVR